MASGTLALAVVAGALLPGAALGAYAVDGRTGEWSASDLIGTGTRPPTEGNASLDLTRLYAGENATQWFFRLDFAWLRPGANASLALYVFGPFDGTSVAVDPSGHGVSFPDGFPLRYAIYLDVVPLFPAGSRVMFFDGALWKNRTFAELGVNAVLNSTAGAIELSASRASFAFLGAGNAAVVELLPAPGGAVGPKALVDSIPDTPTPVGGRLGAVVPFFDYTESPPVEFTQLGLSDPGATEGEAVQVFVEVSNLGPKNVTGLQVQVSVDGAAVGARGGLALLPYGTAVVDFNWTVSAGSHNVTATAQPGGATRVLALQGRPPSPRLRIVDVEPSTAAPAIGQAFSVEVQLHNEAATASPQARLLLKDGTQVIATYTVPAVAPNETHTARLDARLARPGDILLRVEVDGQSGANSTATVLVSVSETASPFGIPAPVILVVGVAGAAAAAWALAPRVARRRERPPPS